MFQFNLILIDSTILVRRSLNENRRKYLIYNYSLRSAFFTRSFSSCRKTRKIPKNLYSESVRGSEIPSQHTSVVGPSARLYWISGNIVTERSKFIELTSSNRSRQVAGVLSVGYLRDQNPDGPRARNGSDSFQKCSFNNPAQSAVDGGVYRWRAAYRNHCSLSQRNRLPFWFPRSLFFASVLASAIVVCVHDGLLWIRRRQRMDDECIFTS